MHPMKMIVKFILKHIATPQPAFAKAGRCRAYGAMKRSNHTPPALQS
jgi:hypothetical protein